MHTIAIKNLAEYWHEIKNYDLITNDVIYRGQAFYRKLLPGIARTDPTVDTTQLEKKMLSEFRRIGAMRTRGHEQDDISILILAQHFGMKTRLLDWTSNPLAALWFACSDPDRQPGNAYVYAADPRTHMLPSADNNPFEMNSTVVIRPYLGNDRIVAQNGWFTLHRYSKGVGRFSPLEEMRSGDLHVWTEFMIPENSRMDLLNELDRCGINQSTLQPDMAGLCAYLNWRHNRTT